MKDVNKNNEVLNNNRQNILKKEDDKERLVKNDRKKDTDKKEFIVYYNFSKRLEDFQIKLAKELDKLSNHQLQIKEIIQNYRERINEFSPDSKDFLIIEKKIKDSEAKLKELNDKAVVKKAKLKQIDAKIKKQNDKLVNDSYIEIKNLKKSYRENVILNNLNFKIKKGERIAIIGENGAGKSTFSGIVSGINFADYGKIYYNFADSKNHFGEETAIQFQKLNYPEGYKVKEIVNFFYRMVSDRKRCSKNEYKHLIKLFGIDNFYHKSLISLSGGQQQRINLFLTFIKKPSFLILDELSAGLDIEIYGKIKKLFKDYMNREKVTLLLISHNLEEIKFFTDTVYLLKNGKLTKVCDSKDLKSETFLTLIKRDNKYEKDFKFNFNIKKEYKTFFLVSYYNFVWRYFVSRINDQEQIKQKIANFRQKNAKLLKEISLIQTKTTKINLLIEKNKNNKKLIKKLEKSFVKEIKKQSKLETKVYKNESKIDKYYFLISSEYLLKKLQKKDHYLAKKIFKIEKNNEAIESKIEHLQNLETKTMHENKSLINLKEKNLYFKNILLQIKEDKIENLDLIKDLEKAISQNVSLNSESYQKKIEIINLKKYYDLKPAVNGINLEIKSGERVAITGPNGSGKTTLSEILATTLEKTLGRITYWFGKNKNQVKHEIGMQFQESFFPYDLSVKEILNLFLKASMWSVKENELEQLIKIFKIDHLLNKKGSILSGGERQKLNVLIALLKLPKLLILDEISTGLDIESIIDINAYIKKYLNETKATLILISHNPTEVKRLAEKLIIMKEGKISKKIDLKDKSEDEVKKIFDDIYLENQNFKNTETLHRRFLSKFKKEK